MSRKHVNVNETHDETHDETYVTPRMLSREFNITPQRVRKILRRAKFMYDARVKNDAWRMNDDDASRARDMINAYITRTRERNVRDDA